MNEKKSDSPGTKQELESLFMGFVALVGNMAMQQMGKTPSPVTGKTEKNLDVARAWIETLKMIEAKTTGNLSSDEKSFLGGMIADLQMSYASEVGRSGTPQEDQDHADKNRSGGAGKKDNTERTDQGGRTAAGSG